MVLGNNTSGHIFDTTFTTNGPLYSAASGVVTSGAAGSAGQVYQSAGAGSAPVYSTATFPSTATGTGKVLRADGTNWAASTATFPNTATSTGTILRADGTNWVASTATFPNTGGTSANLLQSDGTNFTSTNLVQTYVPTTVGSTTAGTQSYTTQQGRWIQIGGMVIVQFDCIGTYGGTAAGNIRLNLPATAATVTGINNWGCGLCINNTNRTGVWQITSGTAYATFATNAGTLENVSASNTFNLQGTICYFVA